MRTTVLTQAVLALCLLTGQPITALADFQLRPGHPAEDVSLPQGDGGLVPSTPEAAAAPRRPPSQAPRFRVAQGFGRQVSLGFAARQIVPPAVAVRFGSRVDPATPVDWTGGQPWNRVLAAAVQPLGLRVVTGATSVTVLR